MKDYNENVLESSFLEMNSSSIAIDTQIDALSAVMVMHSEDFALWYYGQKIFYINKQAKKKKRDASKCKRKKKTKRRLEARLGNDRKRGPILENQPFCLWQEQRLYFFGHRWLHKQTCWRQNPEAGSLF